MHDLKQDLQDYQDLKGWLAGDKPPAQGRTWRRRVHGQVAAVLPVGIMHTIDRTLSYVPYTPFATMMRVTLGSLIVIGGAEFLLMFVDNTVLEASQTLPPITQTLRSLVEIIRWITITTGAVLSLITAVSWVTNGD